MATGGHEGLLRDGDVVFDIDVILIVEPDSFPDPAAIPNM
jgi:hypothetical protein